MKPYIEDWDSLTGAQQRAGGCRPRHGQVVSDASPVAGDVGSGKTAVAACAALRAIESRFSAVVLAPTEILAEQHYRVWDWFRRWASRFTCTPAAKKPRRNRPPQRELRIGDEALPPVVVGTHALVEGLRSRISGSPSSITA